MVPVMLVETVAGVITQELVSRFGTSHAFHSNQGWTFEGRVMAELDQVLGVMKMRPYFTVAYRATAQHATGFSPKFIMFRQEVMLPLEAMHGFPEEGILAESYSWAVQERQAGGPVSHAPNLMDGAVGGVEVLSSALSWIEWGQKKGWCMMFKMFQWPVWILVWCGDSISGGRREGIPWDVG